MPSEIKDLYEFGPYRVDSVRRIVTRDGEIVGLTPKAIDLLLVLVAEAGTVVPKEELMRRVWGDSFVEEANLSHNIYRLREALGDGDVGIAAQQVLIAVREFQFQHDAGICRAEGLQDRRQHFLPDQLGGG